MEGTLSSCRRRLGPHVCLSGFGSGCCPGWAPSMGSGHCTLRKCLSLCPKCPPQQGAPSLGWPEGQTWGAPAPTPSPVFLFSALCSFGCGSGICIAPNVCSCQDGEQGPTCPGNWGCGPWLMGRALFTLRLCRALGSCALAHHFQTTL